MGASSRIDPMKTQGLNRVSIHGSFLPKGTSAPAVNAGKGWSVARTSLGLYTITFDDSYNDLVKCDAWARSADGIPVVCTGGDYDSSAKTLVVKTFTGSSKGFIPLDICSLREIASNDTQALAAHGGLLASDSDPSLARVNGATDKALRVIWDTANDTDEVAFPPVAMPPDLDASKDVSVHLLARMASTTDTPTIDVQAYDGVGDTEMGGATAALSDTLAEVSVTLGNANISGHATGFLNISLVPGAHTTDALWLYAAWIEYGRSSALELADLADDADNEVSFEAIFRNTSVAY